MDPETRLKIAQDLRRARRFVPESQLDPIFCRHTKSALRQAAEEQGLDLALERVSLWRERGERQWEHLGSTRTIYLAVQEAEHYRDELFVFDAIGGEVLSFLTLPPEV